MDPMLAVMQTPWVVIVGKRLNGRDVTDAKDKLRHFLDLARWDDVNPKATVISNSFPEPRHKIDPVVIFTDASFEGERGHGVASICTKMGFQVRFINSQGEIRF